MRIDMIAFTQQGYRLGQKLERILNDEGEQARLACGFGKEKQPLSQWCQRAFSESDALLFIGAAGIAVRAAAPYLVSKTTIPPSFLWMIQRAFASRWQAAISAALTAWRSGLRG